MTQLLSEEARELVRAFEYLDPAERARVLALVRSMSRVQEELRRRLQTSSQLMPV
jgi:hypothetical protein